MVLLSICYTVMQLAFDFKGQPFLCIVCTVGKFRAIALKLLQDSTANLNFKGPLYDDFFLGLMPISATALPDHVQDLLAKLKDFMKEHVYPNESIFEEHQKSDDCWQPHPLMEELKVLIVCI